MVLPRGVCVCGDGYVGTVVITATQRDRNDTNAQLSGIAQTIAITVVVDHTGQSAGSTGREPQAVQTWRVGIENVDEVGPGMIQVLNFGEPRIFGGQHFAIGSQHLRQRARALIGIGDAGIGKANTGLKADLSGHCAGIFYLRPGGLIGDEGIDII